MERIVIIVEDGKQGPANSKAAGWDPDDGSDTFGAVRLSADGTEPMTHTACNTRTSDDMTDGILTALSAVPFAAVYGSDDRLGEGTTYRLDKNKWVELGEGNLWKMALQDAGLQRIETEEA